MAQARTTPYNARPMAKQKKHPQGTIALNKKALHDYFIEHKFEAGLVLSGWEVKSLRAGKAQLVDTVQQKGYTAVALSLYWKQHLVKCEIALAKGKKDFDKRHTEKERDADREVQRAMRSKGKDD